VAEPTDSAAELVNRRLLWPIAEAAELLGISKRTLYRIADHGDLKIVKIGRYAYVSDAELRRTVENLDHVGRLRGRDPGRSEMTG